MNNIIGSIGKRLGNNELTSYLASKEETSRSAVPPTASYVNYNINGITNNKSESENELKVSLVSPSISIPLGMAKRCIPPLGLSYIASYLEQKNISVSLTDCAIEGYHIEKHSSDGQLLTYGLGPKDAAKYILNCSPDVVGISVLFSTDLSNLVDLVIEIKKIKPNILVVVGGLHPTIYPKDVLNACNDPSGKSLIDFIIRGEGEKRLYHLLMDIWDGAINIGMDGLCGYVNGKLVCNNQYEMIEDLDDIPFPAYHLLPMEKYFAINVPFSPVPQGKRVVQIMTTRGCPVGCSFCASTNMYKKYRMRSISNVIGEINYLKEAYDIDEIQFADDNIFFNKKRSMELFSELTRMNIVWCTPNGVMINTLSEELLNLLKNSGLYQVTLSIDSGSVSTLKNLQHKPVKLNTIPGLVERCNQLGIFTHGTLVVGLPGEKLDDIMKGFDFVKKLPMTSISVFIAAAIPGSELYHQAIDDGLITKQNANKINTTRSNINLSDISSDVLEEIVMNFQREFTEKVKERAPDMWKRKYSNLIKDEKQFDEKFGGRLT